MYAHVYEQFVSGAERATLATASAPQTDKLAVERRRRRAPSGSSSSSSAARQRRRRVATLIDMLLDVADQFVLRVEQLTAFHPQTHQRHFQTVLGGAGRCADVKRTLKPAQPLPKQAI